MFCRLVECGHSGASGNQLESLDLNASWKLIEPSLPCSAPVRGGFSPLHMYYPLDI